MANPIEYIVFEPDQVLTNDHLNETFNYLDQQNRWTRNKLIGIGIVCGLDIVLNPGVIQINKGCGITSQGYLISTCTTQYTYYIPYTPITIPADLPFTNNGNLPFYSPMYTGKQIWKLLTDADFNALETAQQATAVTLSSATSFLTDYVVVLFLEAAETELKNCNMLDCNNSGSTMVFTLRPLLVAISDLPGALTIKPELALLNLDLNLRLNLSLSTQVSLKRYNVPYADLNNTSDVLNAFVSLVDDTTLTQVANAYNSCYQQYGALVNATTNPFTNLLTNLQSARSSIQASNPVFIQYLYDFVDDLIKAYEEFTAQATAIVGTCCPDENLFPLHLVLGLASQATNAFTKDNYRNYFIYSALFSKMGEDTSDAALLFNRMVIMVNYFTVQSQALQQQAAITITPSKYEYPPLSDRAIPYYYKLNVSGSELYKYWNYNKTTKGNAARNLSYNASLYSSDATVTQPLLYDIERFNFFRVEGHIGQNQNTVLTNILGQQSKYNLPFDVVAISADLLQTNAPLPQCSFNDLDTDYQLIISEAACKIHTIFCFITKLPYVVKANSTASRAKGVSTVFETPKPTTLKYTAFKLEPATLNITAAATTGTAYKKGDFLRQYCPAIANTIGSGYLGAINSAGVFTNPIRIDQSNSLTSVYYSLFEFVDAVEQLMFEFQTNTLAEIDINAFNTIYQRYLTDTLLALGILIALTEKTTTNATSVADTQYVSLAEDTELALLIDELGWLTNLCLEERMQVLVNEYTNRLTNYQQQLSFLNYYKNHPGLEHKAGVPKGGTLVLVYHSVAPATTANTATTAVAATNVGANRLLITDRANIDTQVAQQAATPVETATLDPNAIDIIDKYINSNTDVPAATRQTLLGILQKIPTRRPPRQYVIPDGTVIADFYIPYQCCSDCPPVAYIVQNVVTPPKPVITMGTTFCDIDTNAEPIQVSAPGGTFNTIPGLDGTKLTFTPATAKAGTYQIIYTLNGVASNPVTVTVLVTPVSTFSFTSEFSTVNDQRVLSATFIPDAQDATYGYQWTFGIGFSETASPLESPQLTAQIDPNGGQTQTSATLTVSNGKCNLTSVTKTLYISPNGLYEAPVNSGSIISDLKNLFTKKKGS
jgi:hypothetical protein